MSSLSPRKRFRSPRQEAWATSAVPCLVPWSNRAIPPPSSCPVIVSARSAGPELTGTGLTLRIPVGAQTVDGYVYESRLPGVGRHGLPDRPTPLLRSGRASTAPNGSDYDDNCERFVFFNRAVLESIRALRLDPDIIHCNDWQTGLIPVYLKTLVSTASRELARPGTLLTIHNLAYLGLFPQSGHGADRAGLASLQLAAARVPRHALLHEGRAWSSRTCSAPSARPMPGRSRRPEYRLGPGGLLRQRQDDLRGIVNGIDTDVWSPSRRADAGRAL